MEQYVYKNHRKLRYGYTTGSCAAAAAKAAAYMLLSGKEIPAVDLTTPGGVRLHLEVLEPVRTSQEAGCAIRKDGGDDPDVTNGILIRAVVRRTEEPGIFLDGGEGVGRVTKPGLEQPVGEAAINRVPRQMIRENLEQICRELGYEGGLQAVISVPEGEALASRTFNPRLGIVGGISILGTTGIVEPMSEQALIDTIRVEIRQKLANGMKYLLIVPGNYGIDFLEEYGHGLNLDDAVKCSNFVGEALDAAVEFGAKGVLLVGHIGKFVKLAGGIMNTHSHNADARMELLTVHAALSGAPLPLLQRMMECVTTDDALKYLKEAGYLEKVMGRLMDKMEFYVNQRAQGSLETGVITFSKVYGVLGQTVHIDGLVEKIGEQRS